MIIKIIKKIKFYIKVFILKIIPSYNFKRGSIFWLISSEKRFGGYVTNVKRNKVSKLDPRSSKEISYGGMTGGDRMMIHGYARHYSNYLKQFLNVDTKNLNILEIGILNGTGLSIWSSLFPEGNIFGGDIDLQHFESNLNNLKKKGAFVQKEPKIFEFDQLDPNYINNDFLQSYEFDIVFDDGLHSKQSILNTLEFFYPLLSKKFLYIIEDVTFDIAQDIKNIALNSNVEVFGELVIISSKHLK